MNFAFADGSMGDMLVPAACACSSANGRPGELAAATETARSSSCRRDGERQESGSISLVSVWKLIESPESVVIQEWWYRFGGRAPCGRMQHGQRIAVRGKGTQAICPM